MEIKNERTTHESFGQISFSRTTCNPPETFYGSELPQNHYITIDLHSSEVDRNLAKEFYFAKKLLARIRMSSGQFAELITSLNSGGGTPCTIEYFNGKPMEPLPTQESRKEFTHRNFQERMSEFAKSIREEQIKARELVKKKTLSKQDIHDLTQHIEWLTSEVENNIPFFMECFQETMDQVVHEAKTEIENAIQHKISVLGIEELHKQNKLIEKHHETN